MINNCLLLVDLAIQEYGKRKIVVPEVDVRSFARVFLERLRLGLRILSFAVVVSIVSQPVLAASEDHDRSWFEAAEIQRQKFTFRYFLMPIGEVEFLYALGSSSADSRRSLDQGGDPECFRVRPQGRSTSYPASKSKACSSFPNNRLVAIEGQTNGFLKWVKKYSGRYESLWSGGLETYRVTAVDGGVPELREIVYDSSGSLLPKVVDFKDSSQADPLSVLPGVDEFSFSPLGLLSELLHAVKVLGSCPQDEPVSYRIFDGKRRYQAIFAQKRHLLDKDIRTVGTPGHGELESELLGSISTTLPEQPVDIRSVNRETINGQLTSDDPVGETEIDDPRFTRRAVRLESQSYESNNLNDTERRVITCILRLNRWSEHIDGQLQEAFVFDRVTNGHQSSRSDPANESPTVAISSDSRRDEEEIKPSSAKTDRNSGLLWPFNVNKLDVEFSIAIQGNYSSYVDFSIEAPLGSIRGTLKQDESKRQ